MNICVTVTCLKSIYRVQEQVLNINQSFNV